jgi:uncharacterized protein (TIGR03437 family)
MNRPRPLMFAAFAAMGFLGCLDTASAQPQLIVTPQTSPSSPLAFNNVPSGGVSPAQTVSVSTANSTMATVILQTQTDNGGNWLVVSPGASVNIPVQLSVRCNTSNLTAGNHTGSITISVDGAQADFVTVYVSLSVSGTSQLSASPPTLSFSAQEGATSATPNGIPVQILSSGVQLNYTLQAQTTNGGNWLLLSATQGSTSGAPFTVSVNPSGLTAASFPAIFNGLITAFSTTTLDAVQISVQVTLNSTAQLSVTPTNPPPFLYQAGTSTDPAPQQLAITSAGGSLAFSIQQNPQVSWLVLSALGGTAGNTPDTITMNATPVEQALTSPHTYTTNLIVTPSGEPALPPIPVSLVVAGHPLIQVGATNLSFSASFAGTPPPAQSVILNGNAVGFTASSNASWLIVGPSSGTTPATLTVQVNLDGLSVQSYNGTITISPTNGDTYTETIAVSLNVSASAQLVVGPPNLLFSYETGQSQPQAQAVAIGSTGQPLAFTVVIATTTCGSNWLSAQPSSTFTNTTVTVGVVTAGLTAGNTCSGTVTLNYSNGLGNASLAIPVTLAVSGSAELSVNMAPGFGIPPSTTQVSAPFQQQISLTSTDPSNQVSYSAAVTNVGGGGAWLGIAGSTVGMTPQNLDIQFSPAAVTGPGTYTGNVVISSPTLVSALTLPVTMTVTSTTTVSVTPSSLSFTEVQGGTPSAAQALTVSSTPGPATYTAVVASSIGGNWLQISPSSGNANTEVQVSVVASVANTLSPGDYPAQISFVFQGAATPSATVNVVLHVIAGQTVAAAPTSLGFAYQIGGTQPASQPVSITSTGGPLAITVAATSTGGWLSVDVKNGTTPQTINVSVNPQGLTAQTYSGSVSISGAGVTTPLSIPVSFTVTSPPAPQPVVILNNATGVPGVIAPGEELAIKGSFLGPSSPAAGVLFSVNSAGGVSSTLAGVQVMFDNNPGTPIFVSANQVNVMVPYEINGRLSTTMVVSYNGVPSAPFQLSVAAAAPGLFTNNFSGSGQVAALNQNSSYNGAPGSGTAPAPRGTVVSLYGTGGGQSNPASVTGSVTPIPTSPSGLLNLPNVTATVGGLPATVQFAGEAPGLVTGVFQVNVLIPAGVTPGNAVPVTVAVGNVSSPLGTTIAVQ